MARAINKLRAVSLRHLRKPGRYSDGAGLWFQVTPAGSKSWLFQYTIHGRVRQMGLGPLHTISLAVARDLAAEARKLVLAGIDPIEARLKEQMRARAEAAKSVTFREAAEQFIKQRRAGWKNAKHADQWSSTLATYAYPVFGDLPVSGIDRGLVLKVLEPIWEVKPETAGRLRSRIANILDAAKARGWRLGENPAEWRGHLDKILPRRRAIQKVRHHPALPYRELPAFMIELRDRQGISARALEFTILTAARTSEVIGAKWDEIDFDEKLWTIPGERMKAGREHRVPLSDRAVEILRSLPRERDNPFVFIGGKSGRHLSNMAMLEFLKEMLPELTVHGFRSTFRDWASESTGYPRDVAEMALAHTIGDKTEAAYRRGDLLDKRRRLMSDWAAYAKKVAGDRRDVVSFRSN